MPPGDQTRPAHSAFSRNPAPFPWFLAPDQWYPPVGPDGLLSKRLLVVWQAQTVPFAEEPATGRESCCFH
ncbi:hypothetical protein NY78_0696 [Desulfovibrio sp. TomC]|nr:hypothetical protein NY78_0696 [Desulfovibrio sp. TomC]